MPFFIDVHKPIYRFTVLFFNCFLTFGSYFCFDMPSVLQDKMQGNYTCHNGTSNSSDTDCCSDCLGMSGSQYNLLYAVYAWTNAVVVIGAGFLIDKFGNRLGVFLFSALCVIGSSLFVIGIMYRGTSTIFPLMLLGRLLLGAGNGSLTIVQNRITSFWFVGKELALAFGVTVAFSRIGSVLNFFLTGHLYTAVGLNWTLWIGAILCGIGFISAAVVAFLDVYGMKELGHSDRLATESKKVRVTDVKYFSASFWLLTLSVTFFSNSVLPFVADASKFIQDKYEYDLNPSAYMAGAVYDVLLLTPFLGGIIDVFGKRGVLSFACSLFTIPVFCLLAFTTVHPLVSTLWLGITYSVAAASMRPSIPLVVPQATIGTAMGLTTAVQMIGIGISNLIVGVILGKDQSIPREETLLRWKYVMIYLLTNTLACVATTIALNINDRRKGDVLNLSRKQVREIADKNKVINPEIEPLLKSKLIN